MNETTVLILNLNNKLDFEKFSKFAKQKLFGANIVIASQKGHKSEFNEYLFETKNDDEVINTLLKKIKTNKLVIVRKFDNNNFLPIFSVADGLKKDNQVCLMSKSCGKVKNFFKKIFAVVVKFMFGYDLLFGSLACEGFGKTCLEILSQLDNPSFYTKVDRWSGVDIKHIQSSSVQNVKFKPKVKKNYLNILLCTAVFMVPLMLWIFVPFFKNSIAIKLLGIFVMGLCFALILINILVLIVKHIVGDNTYDSAEILDEKTSQKE